MNARKLQFNRRSFLHTAGMGMAAAAVARRVSVPPINRLVSRWSRR